MLLITGGTGFIGPELVKKLNQKYKLRCLVRKTSDISKLPEDVELWYGDLREGGSLEGICKDVDSVFHLATIGSVGTPLFTDYEEYREINIEGTRNLLEECVDSEIEEFVYCSSGVCNEEEFPLSSSYAKTKYIAEKLCKRYSEVYDFPLIIVRPDIIYNLKECNGHTEKLLNLIKLGLVPVVDDGNFTLKGMSVYELTGKFVEIFENEKNDTFKFGEKTTLNELIREICRIHDLDRPRKINIPKPLLNSLLYLVEPVYRFFGFHHRQDISQLLL